MKRRLSALKMIFTVHFLYLCVLLLRWCLGCDIYFSSFGI